MITPTSRLSQHHCIVITVSLSFTTYLLRICTEWPVTSIYPWKQPSPLNGQSRDHSTIWKVLRVARKWSRLIPTKGDFFKWIFSFYSFKQYLRVDLGAVLPLFYGILDNSSWSLFTTSLCLCRDTSRSIYNQWQNKQPYDGIPTSLRHPTTALSQYIKRAILLCINEYDVF